MTEYVRPNVTADMLIPNEKGEILLIRRRNDPYKGYYAIPGGFLEVHQETVEECALREAREETGLTVEIDRLIGVYSHPKRDPRWHNVTAAYLARPLTLQQASRAQAGDDAGDILWIDPRSERYQQIPIAFDHRQIIADAMGGGSFYIKGTSPIGLLTESTSHQSVFHVLTLILSIHAETILSHDVAAGS